MNRAERRRQRKKAGNAKSVRSASPSPGQRILTIEQQRLTIQQSVELAVRHHTAGRLPRAERIYQQILQADPSQPVALHLLGVIAHQVGRNDIGVDLITRALAIKPNYAEAHYNLGNVLKDQGKLDEAVASYHKALAIKPDAEVLNNLGYVLTDLGKLDEAMASYHQALTIKPDYAEAHNNLGYVLKGLGKLDEAMESFHKALAIKPDYAEVPYNIGNILTDLGKLDEAIASFHKALAIKPDYAEAHYNLGNALKARGKLDEAVASFHKALAFKPDYVEAYNNLGYVLKDLGKLDEAMANFHKALAIKPDNAEVHYNLGNILVDLGNLDEAMASFHKALAIRPDYVEVHNNLGNVLKALDRIDEAIAAYDEALAGDPDGRESLTGRAQARLLVRRFAGGWSDYLARESMAGRADGFDRDRLPADLSGMRCLVELDQGLGDEIFFLRFAPALEARGARIAYRSDPRLAAMLRRASIVDEIIEGETPTDGWDRRIAVGDLPYVLDAGAEPPPPSIRLEPVPELAREMAERLAAFGPPPHIGLTWRAGSIGLERSLYKSAELDRLAGAMRRVPGTIVALQRAPETDELDRLAAAFGRPVLDLTALNADLEAMLALVGALDDYVTVSNTNVHLRAAAGRRSRVLVPNPPEFRWMARGSESPWFPGTTVYRQDVSGDWAGALDQLGADLIERHGQA